MGLFNHFPYTNFHEMNLDWLLTKVKNLSNTVDNLSTKIIGSDDVITFDFEYVSGSPVWNCNYTFNGILELASSSGALPMGYFRGISSVNARQLAQNQIRFYFPVAISAVATRSADVTGFWIDIYDDNTVERTTITKTLAIYEE